MTLAAIARADFLERVRRPGYLVTLGFMVYAANLFLPPNHAGYATFHLGDYRGIYSSAWVGVVSAMLANAFISLAGFYLVKNAVERDVRTGVGQILAATRLTSRRYLFGKFLSNLAVLASMLFVLAVAVAIVQWVRGEDRFVNPLAIASPLLLVSFPMIAFVAAAAVVFETVPFLRGGFGNVVFFFVWIITLSAGSVGDGRRGLDLSGADLIVSSAFARARELNLPVEPGAFAIGFNIKSSGTWNFQTFDFQGIAWTLPRIAGRLGWLVLSCALPLGATLWFDRFDHARPRGRRRAAASHEGAPVTVDAARRPALAVSALPKAARGSGLLTMIRAELAIALRGTSRWWWLVALGLVIAGALVPAGVPRSVLHGFAWIWPIFMWSALGVRERIHRTSDLLFSAPRPVGRLLTAQWLAGFTIAAAITIGIPVRAVLEGHPIAAFAWLAGAAFIPALALACGVWTRSAKMFEAVYLLLWYAGPINRVPFVDYGGFTPEGLAGGAPFWTAAVAIALLALAAMGRAAQVRSDR